MWISEEAVAISASGQNLKQDLTNNEFKIVSMKVYLLFIFILPRTSHTL